MRAKGVRRAVVSADKGRVILGTKMYVLQLECGHQKSRDRTGQWVECVPCAQAQAVPEQPPLRFYVEHYREAFRCMEAARGTTGELAGKAGEQEALAVFKRAEDAVETAQWLMFQALDGVGVRAEAEDGGGDG